MRPKTQRGEPGNPNREQNCEPERVIPNPRTNPEGKKAPTQTWKELKDHKLNNVHYYMVILTNHRRPVCLWGNLFYRAIIYLISIEINVLTGSVLEIPLRLWHW